MIIRADTSYVLIWFIFTMLGSVRMFNPIGSMGAFHYAGDADEVRHGSVRT